MLFKMADENNDGQISQKEAIDAGNLLVGGFFFRADANGDGVGHARKRPRRPATPFRQQPMLRFVVQRARPGCSGDQPATPAANPAAAFAGLVDTNNDKQLQATEVRQAVQTGVQGALRRRPTPIATAS